MPRITRDVILMCPATERECLGYSFGNLDSDGLERRTCYGFVECLEAHDLNTIPEWLRAKISATRGNDVQGDE